MGCEKTITKVRARFYWVNQRDTIELYVRQCLTCQECKNEPRKPRAPMQSIKAGFPLERLGIDIVGTLTKPTGKGQQIYNCCSGLLHKVPICLCDRQYQNRDSGRRVKWTECCVPLACQLTYILTKGAISKVVYSRTYVVWLTSQSHAQHHTHHGRTERQNG